jgi:hypothetical protein
MKRIFRGGLRADALVSGGKDVELIRNALVTTAGRRTVISRRLGDRVVRHTGASWSCTSSPAVGEVCGPTARVDLALDGCRAASVRAVVAPLLPGLDLAVGRDVLSQVVEAIDFSTAPPSILCRRK